MTETEKVKTLVQEIRDAARLGITTPVDFTTNAGRIKPRAVSGLNPARFMKNADRPRAPTKFKTDREVDYSLSAYITNYANSYDKPATQRSCRWALGKSMLFAHEQLGIEPAKFDLFIRSMKKRHFSEAGRLYRDEVESEPVVMDATNDPYQFLLMLKKWVMAKKTIRPNATVKILSINKMFLEHAVGIPLDNGLFSNRVKPPHISIQRKEAMSVALVRESLLSAAKYKIRFFTFLMCLASGGFRPIEACAFRLKDLHLDAQDSKYGLPYIFVRPDYAKTGQSRETFLTTECAETLRHWLFWKHRKRRMWVGEDNSHYCQTMPAVDSEELVFGSYRLNTSYMTAPQSLYDQFRLDFAAILHIMGQDEFEEGGMRRKYTLHSFRRRVKTTISSIGQYEYSEGFIGHTNSTYMRLTDDEKVSIFNKQIEVALTYLDYNALDIKQKALEEQIELSTSVTLNELSGIKKEKNVLEVKVDKLQSMFDYFMSKDITPEQRKIFLEFAMQSGTYQRGQQKDKKEEDGAYL